MGPKASMESYGCRYAEGSCAQEGILPMALRKFMASLVFTLAKRPGKRYNGKG